jgi:hypothetical protein
MAHASAAVQMLLLYHFFVFADFLAPDASETLKRGLYNSSEATILLLCVYGIAPVMIAGLRLNLSVAKRAWLNKWGDPFNKGTRLSICINRFRGEAYERRQRNIAAQAVYEEKRVALERKAARKQKIKDFHEKDRQRRLREAQ